MIRRQEILAEYFQVGIRRAGVIEFSEDGPIHAGLRDYRERLGWTQTDLARRVGTTYVRISLFESLRRMPQPELAQKITEELAKGEKELFPEITEKPTEEDLFPPYLKLFVRPASPNKNGGAPEVYASDIEEKEFEEAYQRQMDSAEPSVRMDPVKESERRDLHDQLERVVDTLDQNKKRVIRLLYGLEGKEHSQESVGKGLGVTGTRIGQIEQTALRKLRRPPLAKYIEDYI